MTNFSFTGWIAGNKLKLAQIATLMVWLPAAIVMACGGFIGLPVLFEFLGLSFLPDAIVFGLCLLSTITGPLYAFAAFWDPVLGSACRLFGCEDPVAQKVALRAERDRLTVEIQKLRPLSAPPSEEPRSFFEKCLAALKFICSLTLLVLGSLVSVGLSALSVHGAWVALIPIPVPLIIVTAICVWTAACNQLCKLAQSGDRQWTQLDRLYAILAYPFNRLFNRSTRASQGETELLQEEVLKLQQDLAEEQAKRRVDQSTQMEAVPGVHQSTEMETVALPITFIYASPIQNPEAHEVCSDNELAYSTPTLAR